MEENRVLPFKSPSESPEDVLTSVLREGARCLLKQAIEVEFEALLLSYKDRIDAQGHPEVVRNGYLPARMIQTGVGDIEVRMPRVRDRSQSGIVFHSSLLPPYLRRTASVEDLLPWLYLKGVSTGDFSEALQSLLGPSASGLSASSICRLKDKWKEEHDTWQKRDLSTKHYVYFWVDGIYFQARGERDRQCMLVVLGADVTGKKDIVAIEAGFREDEASWKGVLLDMKRRGLSQRPDLAIGDGALGFWKAVREVYAGCKEQRCWVHKTANILCKLPESLHSKAKGRLHTIWGAQTRREAERAMDDFLACYEDKYPKATTCLAKDRETLLAFYDFPAAHWVSIRTTNPIESAFATVRHRTKKTKGCLSLQTGEIMAWKLLQSAQKRWGRLRSSHHIADIIKGVRFKDGLPQNQNPQQTKKNPKYAA